MSKPKQPKGPPDDFLEFQGLFNQYRQTGKLSRTKRSRFIMLGRRLVRELHGVVERIGDETRGPR